MTGGIKRSTNMLLQSLDKQVHVFESVVYAERGADHTSIGSAETFVKQGSAVQTAANAKSVFVEFVAHFRRIFVTDVKGDYSRVGVLGIDRNARKRFEPVEHIFAEQGNFPRVIFAFALRIMHRGVQTEDIRERQSARFERFGEFGRLNGAVRHSACAAEPHGFKTRFFAEQKQAHTLRRVQTFVRCDGEHIEVRIVVFAITRALRPVNEKQHVCRFERRPDFFHGERCARHIAYAVHCHEVSVAADGVQDVLRVDKTVFLRINDSEVDYSVAVQSVKRSKHAVMLECSCDDVSAAFSRAENGEIKTVCTAVSEYSSFGFAIEKFSRR